MLPQPMPRSDFSTGGSHADLASILEQHLQAGFQPDLALDLVLNELVIRAAEATRASSAALALARGDELVCRAATGNFAPDLGVPLNPREGLSGVCLRTREPQLSVDTELDPRVAVAFARRFGIRSVLAVPVFDAVDPDRFTGVLEVFSAAAAAFSRADQRVLEAFAAECARVRQTAAELAQLKSPVEIPAFEPPPTPISKHAPAEYEFDIASIPPRIVPVEEFPIPPISAVLSKEEVPSDAPSKAAAPFSAESFGAESFSAESFITGSSTAESDAAQISGLTLPSLEPAKPEVMAREAAAPEFRALLTKTASRSYEGWTLVLGTLAIFAIIAVSFLIGSRVGGLRSTVSTAQTSANQTSAVAVPASQPAAAPFAPVARARAADQTTSIELETGSAKAKSPRKEATAAPASKFANDNADPDELVVYEKGKVVFRLKNQTRRADQQTKGDSANADMANAGTANREVDPRLAASTSEIGPAASSTTMPSPSRSVWLNPAEAQDRLVSRIEPQYPLAARSAHRTGDVVLEVNVAEDGSVSSVRTVRGDAVLAGAAIDAVRNWRYQPYRLHDHPSEFRTDVIVSFAGSH
jgi:TonB family protein